jgi:hypothetical protein
VTTPSAPLAQFPFQDTSRRTVLWVGQNTPRGLLAVLGGSLDIQTIQPAELEVYAHLACGVVIEVPTEETDARSTYGALMSRALDHGLRVAFVSDDDDPMKANTFYDTTRSIFSDPELTRAVKVMLAASPSLKEFLMAPPSPGCNPALHLEGDVPDEPALQLLLRRAFNDARCISLEPMTGGKSGAHVWLVTHGIADRAQRPLPMLVKVTDLSKMHREFSNAGQAQKVIPFRMLPPLHADRCVEGAELGLLTYGFLEKTIPFADALRTHDAGTLVSSLFGRTLDACLTHATSRIGNVAQPFINLKAFRLSEALNEAAVEAQRSCRHLPDPGQLLSRLQELPAVTYDVGYAHGDLHTGNLFVASASAEVLVIDFGSFSANQPVATDFACLEVSVTFPPDQADEPARSAEAHDELRALYAFPAAVPAARGGSPQGRYQHDAVRAIRQELRQVEAELVAYPVAVAAYLIRYASYADNACLTERALAYELAAKLILEVECHLTGAAHA